MVTKRNLYAAVRVVRNKNGDCTNRELLAQPKFDNTELMLFTSWHAADAFVTNLPSSEYELWLMTGRNIAWPTRSLLNEINTYYNTRVTNLCTVDRDNIFSPKCVNRYNNNIVLISGVFPLITAGQALLIEQLRNGFRTKEIVVGITGDKISRKLRPYCVMPANERAEILRNFQGVDRVVVFEESTAAKLLERISPRYWVTDCFFDELAKDEQNTIKKLNIRHIPMHIYSKMHASDIVNAIVYNAAMTQQYKN